MFSLIVYYFYLIGVKFKMTKLQAISYYNKYVKPIAYKI